MLLTENRPVVLCFSKTRLVFHKMIDLEGFFSYIMRHLSFRSENMCCSPQSCTSFKLGKLLLAGWLLSIGALFFCESSQGDTLPITTKSAEWVSAPGTASLGTIAEMQI